MAMQLTPAQLAMTAAVPPPDGQTSNFIDPPSRAPGAIAAISVLMALAIIAVCLRMYSKVRVSKLVGWDDIMSLLALITAVVLGGFTIAALTHGGLGPHMWDVPLIDFTPDYTRRLLVTQLVFPWTSFFVKASVLLLLLRIFPRQAHPYASILIYVGLALTLVFNFITFIMSSFWCIPRPGSHYMNPPLCDTAGLQLSIASAGFNMVMDLYILAIPVPIVLRLNMSLGKRIAVAGVFTAGLLACLCSILTLYYRFTFRHTEDPSWVEIPALIAANSESFAGIITGCLPCLPALTTHLRANGFFSLQSFLSRLNLSRESQRSHGERLVELHDLDGENGKKRSGSLSDAHSGEPAQDWVYAKAGGKPTTRDKYEITDSMV